MTGLTVLSVAGSILRNFLIVFLLENAEEDFDIGQVELSARYCRTGSATERQFLFLSLDLR